MTPYSLLAPPSRVSPGNLIAESDERLVELAQAGSRPGFEGIVARYRLPLTRYCARLAPEGQAEDTVQETFVKAFKALERGEHVLRLSPWLYRIAHNTALNSVRGQQQHDQPLEDLYEGPDSTTAAVERRLGLRETVTAVQALPLRQRSVIVQHELEGRSYDEIASTMGVTNAAVRQLLSRARTSLRAGAAALLAPLAPLSRLAANMADAPAIGRVADFCGSGGSGAAVKLCATAAVSGAIVSGVQPASEQSRHAGARDGNVQAVTRPLAAAGVETAAAAQPSAARAIASRRISRAATRRSSSATRAATPKRSPRSRAAQGRGRGEGTAPTGPGGAGNRRLGGPGRDGSVDDPTAGGSGPRPFGSEQRDSRGAFRARGERMPWRREGAPAPNDPGSACGLPSRGERGAWSQFLTLIRQLP